MDGGGGGPPPKRQKVESDNGNDIGRIQAIAADVSVESAPPSGIRSDLLAVPVSPPRARKAKEDTTSSSDAKNEVEDSAPLGLNVPAPAAPQSIPSPVQLSHVDGLPPKHNLDALSLRDILGHPLIKEVWAFNYLIDVGFLLEHFDEDIRDSVTLTVVHGSWKKESQNRIDIDEAVAKHANVHSIQAWMPEPFGTHHSKAFVIVRHDDLAQVVICTANFIQQDWRMCQAVWRSPLLPLLESKETEEGRPHNVGRRFKFDFLSYLQSYGQKLRGLIAKLRPYDFSEVKAALIASTPCRQSVSAKPEKETLWGWQALKDVLKGFPVRSGFSHIVVQISSVATLGAEDSWLRKTLFDALSTNAISAAPASRFSIVFPTPEDIRRAIAGYACGGSIHMKLDSPAQQKQLEYLRPMLCRWGADLQDMATARASSGAPMPRIREAKRGRAAPHIKTYLRFSDAAMTRLDWAIVTSANLSKQAWGEKPNKDGEVRICSYELGVVVWPGLWADGHEGPAEMIPTFQKDTIPPEDVSPGNEESKGVKVALRMPYDLPLVRYSSTEEPWCATKSHVEPDWMGRVWQVG